MLQLHTSICSQSCSLSCRIPRICPQTSLAVLPPLSAPRVCNYTTLSASGQEILQPSLAIFRTTDIKNPTKRDCQRRTAPQEARCTCGKRKKLQASKRYAAVKRGGDFQPSDPTLVISRGVSYRASQFADYRAARLCTHT